MYTTRKVTDHHSFVSKCDFFNTTYTATLRPIANYNPGFKFLDLPGASLNIISVLNTYAIVQEAEQIKSNDSLFALEFYRNILIPAIEGLAIQSKTRSNNLVTAFRHSNTLPIYFRIFQEDLPALSQSIETQFATSDHNTTYHYFFVYFKFGQMKTIVPPITMQSLNLDLVVADSSILLGASIHVALNFAHIDPRYSVFWSTDNTASYLRGMSTRKYPFLGLNEVSNVTSTFPARVQLYQAIASRERTVTRYTYSQAYTPTDESIGSFCIQKPTISSGTPAGERLYQGAARPGTHLQQYG